MPDNQIRRRNPVARAPLLRKGGAHLRCRSSERQQQKIVLQDALDDWTLEKDSEHYNDSQDE